MTLWRVEVWRGNVRLAVLEKMAGTKAAVESQMKAVYGNSVRVKLTEVKR